MTETGRGGSAGIATDRESGRERTKESRIDFGRGATAALEEPPQMDLSTEVRVKLRRLDKLEGRYQGGCELPVFFLLGLNFPL